MELNENAQLDTSQVEDLRGSPGAGGGGGGGLGGLGMLLPLLLGRGKVGVLIAVVLAVVLCVGGGFGTNLLGGGGGGGEQRADNRTLEQKCDRSNRQRFEEIDCRNLLFVNSIQAYWQQALPQSLGQQYRRATTNFFSQGVTTACGAADSGVGPFYCPGDSQVYIDLTFYRELAERFGASGRFAEAYVLAHEYGHHVQNLLGTMESRGRGQQRDPAAANRQSIMLELQADCYAGAWTKSATQTTNAQGEALFKNITQQDIDEALQAAAAVGDDTIQKRTTGRVDETKFNHGTAKQRQFWFSEGYRTGDPKACDTFGRGV
jgi:hypothetical protein